MMIVANVTWALFLSRCFLLFDILSARDFFLLVILEVLETHHARVYFLLELFIVMVIGC